MHFVDAPGSGLRGAAYETGDDMSENLKTFIEAAQADAELCKRLSQMSAEELLAEAKKMGFELTEEDLKPPSGEVGDEELANISGAGGLCIGFGFGCGTNSNGHSYDCWCIVTGSGDQDNRDNCPCSFVGMGSSD